MLIMQYEIAIKVPTHPMARMFSRVRWLYSSRPLEFPWFVFSPHQLRGADLIERERRRGLNTMISALPPADRSCSGQLEALIG